MASDNALTDAELKYVRQVAKDVQVDKHCCFVAAQRLALYSDGRILYHEGTFNGTLAHAWNSINDKLIDISTSFGQIVPPDCYGIYDAKLTRTGDEVMRRFLDQKGLWTWFSDPRSLGTVHEG